jgi:hypothetical protein
VAKDDPDPKALACYGLLVRSAGPAETAEAVWLRFVAGRPVSAITTLVLVWDNAGWHSSRDVRRWLRAHNQRAHREGGVRLVPCFLPTRSPWLNPIEPKWVHGKRRVAEPARLLTATELEHRVCAAFACPLSDHLAIPQEVA